MVIVRGEAEDFLGSFLPLGGAEHLGFAGEFDAAVETRLDPHLTVLLALGVAEPLGLGGPHVLVAAEHTAALYPDVGRPGQPPGRLGHGFPLAPGDVGYGHRAPAA